MDDKRKHDLWGGLLKLCTGTIFSTLFYVGGKIWAKIALVLYAILDLIKKEGEDAAKKKKEVLSQRITPLPTLNGMSK